MFYVRFEGSLDNQSTFKYKVIRVFMAEYAFSKGKRLGVNNILVNLHFQARIQRQT